MSIRGEALINKLYVEVEEVMIDEKVALNNVKGHEGKEKTFSWLVYLRNRYWHIIYVIYLDITWVR